LKEENVDEARKLLTWLGSPAAITAALALLAERSAYFQALSSERKTQIMALVCFGLPALSAIGLTVIPPEWYEPLGYILGVLGVGAMAYIANQGTHWLDKSVSALLDLVRVIKRNNGGG
jgi:hypothetical protein